MELRAEGYGRNLRNARHVLLLDQEGVARLIGVDRTTVSVWENERAYPLAKHRFRLHQELGINPLTLALPQTEETA